MLFLIEEDPSLSNDPVASSRSVLTSLLCLQIDNGIENTGNRKFLRIVPIILFMASYRQTSGANAGFPHALFCAMRVLRIPWPRSEWRSTGCLPANRLARIFRFSAARAVRLREGYDAPSSLLAAAGRDAPSSLLAELLRAAAQF